MISILDELIITPENFTIEYKVVDVAGNENSTLVYNNGYEFILFSREKSIILSDNTIDLNSNRWITNSSKHS